VHLPKSARRSRSSRSRRLADEMESISMSAPIGPEILNNILRGRPNGSVEEVMGRRTFEKERNRHEVLLLSRVLDCLRDRRYEAARELLLRRISGVQLADRKNNWEVANALLAHTEGSADLPENVLRRALKTAASVTALGQGASAASGSTGYGRSSGRSGTNHNRSSTRGNTRGRSSGGANDSRSSQAGSYKGNHKSSGSSQPKGNDRA
jgi:hypothetical protein